MTEIEKLKKEVEEINELLSGVLVNAHSQAKTLNKLTSTLSETTTLAKIMPILDQHAGLISNIAKILDKLTKQISK